MRRAFLAAGVAVHLPAEVAAAPAAAAAGAEDEAPAEGEKAKQQMYSLDDLAGE